MLRWDAAEKTGDLWKSLCFQSIAEKRTVNWVLNPGIPVRDSLLFFRELVRGFFGGLVSSHSKEIPH